MKTLLILLTSYSSIYSVSKRQLLNTDFNRDHCENWKTLTFTKNNQYELIESIMGGPPWRIIGQYEIRDNEVELRPKSCKVWKKIKTKEDQEMAKGYQSRCDYGLRRAICVFRTVAKRDFTKELACTEQESNPTNPKEENRLFRFRNFKREREFFRNCIIPYPKDE